MHRYSRRQFLQGSMALAGFSLLLTAKAPGQQAAKVPRIGFLAVGSREGRAFLIDGFLQGLREHGYVEGQNIVIEYRFSEDRNDRLPALAAELVALKVRLILASGTPASFAAKHATSTIPIVMGGVAADPVETGLVSSLAHPGGNITGMSMMTADLGGKRLELLKQIVPGLVRVAVFWNPPNLAYGPILRELEAAAPTLGVKVQRLEVRVPADFEGAFKAATRQRRCADRAGRPPGLQPAKNGRRSRAQVPTADDDGHQRVCGSRGPAVAGAGPRRFIPAGRNPRGQNPEGGTPGAPAGGAAHQVRVCGQTQDRTR